MAWPNDPCPPGGFMTAKHTLTYIINKAMAEHPPNETYVVTLATRCMGNHCLKPWEPPASDHLHCNALQRAKFFADHSQWYQVANELEHGM